MEVYPIETTTHFQPSDICWEEVESRVNSIEALRLNDPFGPTNNLRGKFLIMLVQALAELGESKEGNIRMKELLEKRVTQ
jgi:hypothetical protein